jgi:hypothetical protein
MVNMSNQGVINKHNWGGTAAVASFTLWAFGTFNNVGKTITTLYLGLWDFQYIYIFLLVRQLFLRGPFALRVFTGLLDGLNLDTKLNCVLRWSCWRQDSSPRTVRQKAMMRSFSISGVAWVEGLVEATSKRMKKLEQTWQAETHKPEKFWKRSWTKKPSTLCNPTLNALA